MPYSKRRALPLLSAIAVIATSIAVPGAAQAQSDLDDLHEIIEDSIVATVNVLDNDPDGSTIRGFSSGAKGVVGQVLVDDVVVALSYEPNDDEFGTDTFTYDGTNEGGDYTATVTVQIEGVPDSPTADDDDVLDVPENSTVEVSEILLDGDADVDGDDLTIIGVGEAENGTTAFVVDEVDGSVTVTYEASDPSAETDSFTYTIWDGTFIDEETLRTAQGTVSVTIVPEDDPTIAVDDEETVLEGGSETIDVLQNDEDPDEILDPVVITVDPDNGDASVNEDNEIEYTHDGSETTDDELTYSVGESTAVVSIIIEPSDDATVANDDLDIAEVTEGSTVSLEVRENDTDVDSDPVALVASVTEPTFGETAVGLLGEEVTYASTGDDLGEVTFEYTNVDGNTATVTLTVVNGDDDPPAVDPVDDIEILEDADSVTVSIFDEDTRDVDGDLLSISVGPAALGVVSDVTNNSFVYTPTADANGTDTLEVTVSDGTTGDEQTLFVDIVIAPENDAPVANPDPFFDVDEDTSEDIDVLFNDTDVDLDELSISEAELTDGEGTVAIVDGRVQVSPAEDYFGPIAFSYVATDGDLFSETVDVSGFVRNTEDPLVAVDDEASVDEDDVVRIDVMENDIDVDETGFELISITQPENGLATITGTEIRVQPDPEVNGVLTFEYTIRANYPVGVGERDFFGPASCEDTDTLGGFPFFFPSPPGCELITGTVTVEINATNDRPEAFNDEATTDEDESVSIDVMDNDTDSDGDDLSIYRVNAPRNGTTEIVDGEILYTPEADFNGDDAFVYYLTDGDLLSIGLVNVTIDPVNDAPTIEADDITTDEDTDGSTTVAIDDIDSDDLTLSVRNVDEELSLAIDGNTITATPARNVFGEFTFEAVVTDDDEAEAFVEVTVFVESVNDLPEIEAEDIVVYEDDDPGFVYYEVYDVEDGSRLLSVDVTTQPELGFVEVEGDVVYFQNENAWGEDSFTLTVTDTDGGTASVVVGVMIHPVNDLPEITEAEFFTDEDVDLDMTIEITDVDDEELDVELGEWSGSETGELSVEGNKVYYTPAPDFHGEVYFDLIVTDAGDYIYDDEPQLPVLPIFFDRLLQLEGLDIDFDPQRDGEGEPVVGSFLINVRSINDRPEMADQELTVDEDDEATLEIVASDVEDDFGGIPLSFEIETQPSVGTASIEGSTLTYTPSADVSGSDSLVLKVTDKDGGTDTATVSVTINNTQDAPIAQDCAGMAVVHGDSVDIDTSDCAMDIDGDKLSVEAGSASAEHGAVAVTDGELSYTAPMEFLGTETVSFRITDGEDSVDVSIDMTVQPRPYAGTSGTEGELVRIYRAMLGRYPDAEGFEYWTELRNEGLALRDMITYFGISEEFVNTFGDRLISDTDEDWVDFVYREILDRPADAVGREYWLEQLGEGLLTREDMVVFFAESDEYKRLTQTS